MAFEHLISGTEAVFHRPAWSESMEASESAADYESQIRAIHEGGRPDVVLLGLGDDGHTASLFPGTTALEERERWIAANYVPQLDDDRLTATYPLLWASKVVMFLVVGSGKAKALKDSFEGLTPAGKVGEGDAKVEWHVDASAASLLS